MTIKEFTTDIRSLIAKDNLTSALQRLAFFLENSPKLNEVIQQSGKYADLEKQIRQGTIRQEDASVSKNQIRSGLLALLDDINAKEDDLNLQEEVKRIAEDSPTISYKAEKIYNIDHIDNANFS